jgi:hypothetical protein
MKNTIGIIALLLVSQSLFADDMNTKQTETKPMKSETATEITPVTSEPAMAMKEQSGFSRGSVVRSAFTTEINDREPAENLQSLTNDNGQVKFFTELRDMSGQTAIHRWEYDGKVVAEIAFDVKGPRWRVWSSKSLVPAWTGEWKVSVINAAGEVISEKNLSYDIATAPIATPSTTDAAAETEPTK